MTTKKTQRKRYLKLHEADEIRVQLSRGGAVSDLAKQWRCEPKVIEGIRDGLIYVRKSAKPQAPTAAIPPGAVVAGVSEKTAKGIALLAAHDGVTEQEVITAAIGQFVRERLGALAAEWATE